MLIHYFYIFKYKAIENVGIRLNGRYDYAMDTDKKVMTMSENPNWVEGFWPEGVSTLTAIVGSNGSCKTTFMEAMLLMVEKGNDDIEIPERER
jgi:AAA15 family ATPase/GTPase